jgi:roadblock/LC7 domain-containing protein
MYYNKGLCYISRDGKINRRFLPLGSPFFRKDYPIWTVDGNGILYCDNAQQYHLIDVVKNQDTLIQLDPILPPRGLMDDTPAFHRSPDGKWLFYYTNWNQGEGIPFGWLSLDGTVFRYNKNRAAAYASVYQGGPMWWHWPSFPPPLWSKDCKKIAILMASGSIKGDPPPVPQIWIIDLITGNISPVCIAKRDSLEIASWTFSPDGRYVAYLPDVFYKDNERVMLCDTQTGTLIKIHNSSGIPPIGIMRFSPDSKWLVYLGAHRSFTFLNVLESKGYVLTIMNGEQKLEINAIYDWNPDENSLTFEHFGQDEILKWYFDKKICERIWPPEKCEYSFKIEEFTTQRIPFEKEQLQPWREQVLEGKATFTETTSTVIELPVQVVDVQVNQKRN